MKLKFSSILIIIALTTSCSMKKIMFVESESKYDFKTTVEELTLSLEKNDWVISHTSDRQDYYGKHGLDFTEMVTIDICKPEPSHKVMMNDKNKKMAPMAPMRIAIYNKNDGKTYISRMRLKMMKSMTSGIIKKMMKISAIDIEKAVAPIIK